MNRLTQFLVLVIIAEVVVVSVLAAGRLGPAKAQPPGIEGLQLDPATAAEIQAAAAMCHTPEEWRTLAELFMAAGCFHEAERCHRVAARLNPRDPLLARQWGFALERLGRLDEANTAYRRAIELGTTDPDACHYFVGRNLLRTGDSSAAEAEFRAGDKLAANRYELARLAMRREDLNQAEPLLRGLKPADTLQEHLALYRLARERDDARMAAVESDRARYALVKLPTPFDEEAKRIVDVTKMLGTSRVWATCRERIEQGDLTGAERLLQESAQPIPGAEELRAEIELGRNHIPEAVELLRKVEAANGPTARLAARQGDFWATAGDFRQAQTAWKRALELEAGADLKHVQHALADSYAQTGEPDRSRYHRARGHDLVGRDILRAGGATDAVRYFQAAVEQDASLVSGWFGLGEAHRLRGAAAEAIPAYQACLKLQPDHGRARAALKLLNVEQP